MVAHTQEVFLNPSLRDNGEVEVFVPLVLLVLAPDEFVDTVSLWCVGLLVSLSADGRVRALLLASTSAGAGASIIQSRYTRH